MMWPKIGWFNRLISSSLLAIGLYSANALNGNLFSPKCLLTATVFNLFIFIFLAIHSVNDAPLICFLLFFFKTRSTRNYCTECSWAHQPCDGRTWWGSCIIMHRTRMSIAWIQVIEILFAINRKHWEIVFFWNFRMKKLNFGQLLPHYWPFNCPYTYYLLSWKWHELGSQRANINKYTNGKIVFEISLERSKKGLGPFFISILRNRISPLVCTTYLYTLSTTLFS